MIHNLPKTLCAVGEWNTRSQYVPVNIPGCRNGEYGVIFWEAMGDHGFPVTRYSGIHVESGADLFDNQYAETPEECVAEMTKIIAATSQEKLAELFASARRRIEENQNRISPPVEKKKRGAVYLIKVADRYKLGQSVSPEQRIGNMQLPSKPQVVLIHRTEKYREAEKELHIRFAHRRQHGEWFNFDPQELEIVQEAIRTY